MGDFEWIKDISNYIFVILLVGVVIYYIYEYYEEHTMSDVEKYTEFSEELQADMNRYGIAIKDQQQIEEIVDKMIEKKKKEKNVKKVINACKNGLIRGCIVGFVSGGIPGAIASGATYGVVNGVMNGFFES